MIYQMKTSNESTFVKDAEMLLADAGGYQKKLVGKYNIYNKK